MIKLGERRGAEGYLKRLGSSLAAISRSEQISCIILERLSREMDWWCIVSGGALIGSAGRYSPGAPPGEGCAKGRRTGHRHEGTKRERTEAETGIATRGGQGEERRTRTGVDCLRLGRNERRTDTRISIRNDTSLHTHLPQLSHCTSVKTLKTAGGSYRWLVFLGNSDILDHSRTGLAVLAQVCQSKSPPLTF